MKKSDIILRLKWLLAIMCFNDYYKTSESATKMIVNHSYRGENATKTM